MEVVLMMKLKNYKELIVWQKAYQLCLDIYKITKRFPKSEVFGLSYDLKRIVISIPSNIAEGYGRQTTKEYIRFLYIAYRNGISINYMDVIYRNIQLAAK